MYSSSEVGRFGENKAVEWLRCNGYLICSQNWRSGNLEIDIVAQKCDSLHFIEVKTRRMGGLTSPEYAMNRRKIEALKRIANIYIAHYQIDLELQFDLVAVDLLDEQNYEIRYIPNVIECNW